MSALRKGERARAAPPPTASTARVALTDPVSVSASTPPAPSLRRRTGERSKSAAPRSMSRSRRPRASRAGCTVAASAKSAPARKRGEEQRSATWSGLSPVTSSGPAVAGTEEAASCRAPSWAAAAETCMYPDLRYQASISCSSQKRPTASTESAEARQSSSAAVSPNRSRRVAKLSHIELTKPPFRPLGPCPNRSASSTTTLAEGSASSRCQAAHIPV